MRKINFFKPSILAATLMLAAVGFAQDENLVENGSFEASTGKPKKLGALSLSNGWIKPTGQPADFFIPAVKVPEIGTPDNFYGTEEAQDGRNYAGIVAYSYNDKMPRSYAMAKLLQPLKKGARYCVTFHVSLAEASKYSTNAIGANFSKKPYASEAKTSIIEKTHIQRSDNKILSGFYGWDKVCNVYTAEGGEKYITIGNFTNNNQVGYEKMRKPNYYKGAQIVAAYYYLDNVSVKLIDDITQCDCSLQSEEDSYSKLVYQKSIVVTDKMKPKDKIEAQSVFFAFGKAQVPAAGKASLDEIVSQMKADANLKLEIQGHMEDIEVEKAGENPMFQDLDEVRADVVKEYLVEAGIAANRITIVKKSNSVRSTEVIESDNDELKSAKTRRVTFVVK
ncbi:MAG: OmpA family protein [Flavobacteriia bacterium]|nr:OmpA family protein [Flavobacteriia bacterium]